MPDIILSPLILAAGFILGLFAEQFLPGYFREKGKNLATKEDIAEITAKVEETKLPYVKELELLKIHQADLQIRKAQEYLQFTDYIAKLFTNPGAFGADLNQQMMDFGTRLFFFASDETVKSYLEFRQSTPDGSPSDADRLREPRRRRR